MKSEIFKKLWSEEKKCKRIDSIPSKKLDFPGKPHYINTINTLAVSNSTHDVLRLTRTKGYRVMNENCLTNKSKLMVGKISVMLTVLISIQTTLYAFTGEATNLNGQALHNRNLTAMAVNKNDVNPMLNNLGIKTKVNEEELEEKYPSVKVSTNAENGNATLKFHNPNNQNYRLDIYDLNKGLVASFVNINSDQIEIEREMFNAGAYIYKLVGDDASIYCGTFMLR